MKARVAFAVAIAVVEALLLGGGSVVGARDAHVAAQARPEMVPSPTDWVALEAKFKTVSPERTVWGRYYRRSDGSYRIDTGPNDGVMEVISANNVATSMHYEYAFGKWTSNPMVLPPEGFHPRPRPFPMRGIEAWPEPIHGFQVYRYEQPGGPPVVRLQAPALNFLALVTESGDTRQEYFDIRLLEPPVELFSPPAGVAVEARSNPRGIVWSTGRQTPPR